MAIYKVGKGSTLTIVAAIKGIVPIALQSLPQGVTVKPLFDQSLFVRASINGVLREALIAAALTAVMILIFLGDWRPTIVISISIPLSIFVSVLLLSALGETINIMTLGGLALAVGILVDDATVEIENIERNLAQGKEMKQAILDGASQIAVPAFVSTLSICIVFVPMFFLTGVARFLFVPLAEAVCFAMLASYFLSRTLIPTLVMYIMRGHEHRAASGKTFFGRYQRRFERGFDKFRNGYYSTAGDYAGTSQGVRGWLRCVLCTFSVSGVFPGRGFLSQCRCRADAASRPRARRHAGGGNGKAVR
jgi:multidrug efflux pump subunit AcrB